MSGSMTPASQLLEKLILQQQQAANNKKSSASAGDDGSPLLLFQHSCRVSLRETAAQRSGSSSANSAARTSRVQQHHQQQHAKAQEEADLYRRAQLRTPAENAKRCLWGGPLWVQYLTQELSKQASSLIWVSTTSRPVPKWVSSSSSERDNISVVHAASLNNTFWDQDEGGNEENQHPLEILISQIKLHLPSPSQQEQDEQSKKQQQKQQCVPIVLESVTPLVQLYGFAVALQFVKQLLRVPGSLILIPVLTETLPSNQHQQMEDLAHTVLWLSNHTGQGDLHVLRKGIREQDSTVREIWNFALRPVVASMEQQGSENLVVQEGPFRLIVGENDQDADENDGVDNDQPEQVNLLEEIYPEREQQPQQPLANIPEDPVAGITKSTKKVTLKMEDDNEKKGPPTKPTPSTSNAPRIYLQDDDPEFEDYDEEDPDDDLEI